MNRLNKKFNSQYLFFLGLFCFSCPLIGAYGSMGYTTKLDTSPLPVVGFYVLSSNPSDLPNFIFLGWKKKEDRPDLTSEENKAKGYVYTLFDTYRRTLDQALAEGCKTNEDKLNLFCNPWKGYHGIFWQDIGVNYVYPLDKAINYLEKLNSFATAVPASFWNKIRAQKLMQFLEALKNNYAEEQSFMQQFTTLQTSLSKIESFTGQSLYDKIKMADSMLLANNLEVKNLLSDIVKSPFLSIGKTVFKSLEELLTATSNLDAQAAAVKQKAKASIIKEFINNGGANKTKLLALGISQAELDSWNDSLSKKENIEYLPSQGGNIASDLAMLDVYKEALNNAFNNKQSLSEDDESFLLEAVNFIIGNKNKLPLDSFDSTKDLLLKVKNKFSLGDKPVAKFGEGAFSYDFMLAQFIPGFGEGFFIDQFLIKAGSLSSATDSNIATIVTELTDLAKSIVKYSAEFELADFWTPEMQRRNNFAAYLQDLLAKQELLKKQFVGQPFNSTSLPALALQIKDPVGAPDIIFWLSEVAKLPKNQIVLELSQNLKAFFGDIIPLKQKVINLFGVNYLDLNLKLGQSVANASQAINLNTPQKNTQTGSKILFNQLSGSDVNRLNSIVADLTAKGLFPAGTTFDVPKPKTFLEFLEDCKTIISKVKTDSSKNLWPIELVEKASETVSFMSLVSFWKFMVSRYASFNPDFSVVDQKVGFLSILSFVKKSFNEVLVAKGDEESFSIQRIKSLSAEVDQALSTVKSLNF